VTLDAAAIAWLRSEDGRSAASQATSALDESAPLLSLVESLRARYGADGARWAVALAEGRRTARGKFPDADDLYLDRGAAEQATSTTVARHTAARFAGATRIADLGCGAGADSLALAEHAPVVAVDADAGRVAMAEANATVRGAPVTVLQADVLTLEPGSGPLAGVDAAWFDPGRRDERGRVLDPHRWTPPLPDVLRTAMRFPRAGIKVAPGIEHAEVPSDAELEFISLDGRLVEAVIWMGAAVTARRRATVLPAGDTIAGEPDSGGTRIAPPGATLYDLDPAVGRASLVDVLAPQLDAWLLSEGVGYLAADAGHETPFARRFAVLEWFAFAERRLLDACLAAGATRVEVMRRASPVDTNTLEGRLNRALPGGGGRVLTVALTRSAGEHVAILCERVRPEQP